MQSLVEADDLAADAEAQFKLARAVHGRAIETLEPHRNYDQSELEHHADFVEAARRYKLAADQGHLRALIALSDLYDKGIGVAKSRDESLLQDGKRGVQPDLPEAARLYKLAGEAGISSAYFDLALMHDKGQARARARVRTLPDAILLRVLPLPHLPE
jgi:TPR repeat protein